MSGWQLVVTVYVAGTLFIVLATIAVRHLTIVRTLRRHGQATLGLFTWNIYEEARRYRELCESTGEPLRWWYVWWTLHLTGAALVIGGWLFVVFLN